MQSTIIHINLNTRYKTHFSNYQCNPRKAHPFLISNSKNCLSRSFHPRQFYSIVVSYSLAMEQHQSFQNSYQEIEFILKSIFIIHPNGQSKYKLKVVVHHRGTPETVKRNNTYLFRIPAQKEKRVDEQFGYVSLLETKDPKEPCLEIGRGEIELRDGEWQKKGKETTINGIIYGTRTFNYDRVIAKYSYKIRTRLIEQQDEFIKQKTTKNTINFLNHKRKEKLPSFQFKQSILQHTKQINNKIKQLTSSMNSIIGEANEEEEQGSVNGYSKGLLQSRVDEIIRKDEYFYRYGDKFLIQLKNTFRNEDINRMSIKNIKIKEESIGKIRNIGKFGKQKSDIFLDKIAPTSENQQKRQNFMFSFFEIIDKDKIRRKILQICLQLAYNSKNSFLQNISFYLPKTSNPIIVEGVPLHKKLKANRLQGLIQYSYSKNRMIDFYDQREEERGYMIALIEPIREIQNQYIKSYQSQLAKFERLVKEQPGNGIEFSRKYSTPIERLSDKRYQNKQKPSIQAEYQRLSRSPPYQPMIERKSISGKNIAPNAVSNNTNTRAYQSLEKTPRRQRINENRSLINKRVIQQYSNKPNARLLNIGNSNRKISLNLILESIYISLYDNLEKRSNRITVQFQMDEKIDMRKANVGYNQMEKNTVNLCFSDIDSNEILRITCLTRNSNERYKSIVLGNCNIIAKQLLKDPKNNSFRTFIYLNSKIVGFIIIDFRFTQQNVKRKNEIEPQSFQYDLSNLNVAETPRSHQQSDSQYYLSLTNFHIQSLSPEHQKDNYSEEGDSQVLVDQDYDKGFPSSFQI